MNNHSIILCSVCVFLNAMQHTTNCFLWEEGADCLPTVVSAPLIQHSKKVLGGWLFCNPPPLKIEPSWLRHYNVSFPWQAQQRQDSVCQSQPVKRTWPQSVQGKGLWTCSHDSFCCQGSNLWQKKKDSVSNCCKLFPKGSGALSLPSSWICITASFWTHRTAEEFRGSLKISSVDEMDLSARCCVPRSVKLLPKGFLAAKSVCVIFWQYQLSAGKERCCQGFLHRLW